jgi:alpha-beta hydrolase superfamily lysophospholipase
MFAYPGGGYNRHYYDLQLAEGPGYSQAEYHAAHGFVFVALDHLGTGSSSVPTQPLDYDAVARANTGAAREIFDRLQAGALDRAIPPTDLRGKVAMGQSFGGFLLIIAQGGEAYFDGVAILGSSAIQTVPPWDARVTIEDIASGAAGNGLEHPMRRFFHWPDVPESIVIADLTKTPGTMAGTAPWSTGTAPGGPALSTTRGPLDPGAVAAEAAAIKVPVFIGSGEIDVVADPRAEPTAYSASPDITVAVYRKMAHMHNFATTRRQLWERLAYWAEGITNNTVSEE